MKRLLPTLLLVIVCVGGFWYASSQNFFREPAPEDMPVADFAKEDVVGFSIKSSETEIEMELKEDGWVMIKPDALPLNGFTADNWVGLFTELNKEFIVEENPSDLAQYGLEEPEQAYTVKLKDGSERTFLVGDPVPIPNLTYAKYSTSSEVFRIKTEQLTPMSKTPVDFMQQHPIQINFEQVQSMKVTWQNNQWSLVRHAEDQGKGAHEARWTLDGQELDGAAASTMLDKAIFMSTKEILKRSSEVAGMDQPELRIEIVEAADGGDAATVYTGKLDGETVWLVKQGTDWAYALTKEAIQGLYNSAADMLSTKEEGQTPQQGE